MPHSELEMLEMPVPEYFVTHIGRIERVAGGCIRMYCCVVRGRHLEPVYSVIRPVETLLLRTKILEAVEIAALSARAH